MEKQPEKLPIKTDLFAIDLFKDRVFYSFHHKVRVPMDGGYFVCKLNLN